MSKYMDSEGLVACQYRIGRLFYSSGNQNNFNLLNIEFIPDNCSLSSWNIQGWKNSILILENLMIGWSWLSMPPKISQWVRTTEQRDLSNEETVQLEKEVAALYCQTFCVTWQKSQCMLMCRMWMNAWVGTLSCVTVWLCLLHLGCRFILTWYVSESSGPLTH